MRFFTQAWREADSPDAEAVFAAYDAHFEDVGKNLPTSAHEFHATQTLHDAEVKQIDVDAKRATVTLLLEGWDANLQDPLRFELRFGGLHRFQQRFTPGAPAESGIGDIAHYEWDWLRGPFEFSMLFTSSAEFVIEAETFEYSTQSRKLGRDRVKHHQP
jgi:hypothetical protein